MHALHEEQKTKPYNWNKNHQEYYHQIEVIISSLEYENVASFKLTANQNL